MSKKAPSGPSTEQSPEDMIQNVEKMLQQEKQMAKATAKGGAKLVSFDMNEGLVGSIGKKEADASELDEDIEVLKARKNQAVKADNVNNMFLENIGAITDSVNTFA